MIGLARVLIIGGIILLILGGGVYLAVKTGIPLGRLPGDIHIERENFSFYFPLATMIILSVILTVILNVVVRLINR